MVDMLSGTPCTLSQAGGRLLTVRGFTLIKSGSPKFVRGHVALGPSTYLVVVSLGG